MLININYICLYLFIKLFLSFVGYITDTNITVYTYKEKNKDNLVK
jgi:hypothetical protein